MEQVQNQSVYAVNFTAVVLTACGNNAGTEKAEGQGAEGSGELKKVVLRLKWIHQAQFAGFYTAVEKGFYKEAGLDVEIRPGARISRRCRWSLPAVRNSE